MYIGITKIYYEDSKSVKWIVEYMNNKQHKASGWLEDETTNPHEANFLKLDISKARDNLGWEPIWNLEQTLEKVIEWDKHWLTRKDIENICEQHIKIYSKF